MTTERKVSLLFAVNAVINWVVLGSRLSDGTLMMEEPKLDPVTGRIETTWYWSGPRGSGSKTASIRVYAATELIRLLEPAGLKFRAVYSGCSTEPFLAPDGTIGVRLGVLAVRD